MSDTSAPHMVTVPAVLTLDDLAKRWQAPGKTKGAIRKWVWRRVHAWSVPHEGEREPRFQLRAVMNAEQRRMGS